jgi:hypothetical protein
MNRPWKCVLIAAFVSIGASAQTAVTTSGGTTYNIPVFNGAASLGASPIYASGNNVGIGTTAPMTALQVMGSISAQAPGGDPSFVLYKGDGGAANLYSGIANTGTNGFNRLSFFTNNAPQWAGSTENMVILNSGNVGIGTTTPNAFLHIVDQNGIVIGTSSTSGFGSGNLIIQSSYGARTPGTGAALTFALPANLDGSNPAEQVRIVGTPDSSGNGDAHGRMYLQTRTMNQAGNAWIWNSNLLLTSDGSTTLGGNLKLSTGAGASITFSDSTVQSTAWTGVLSGGDYAESVDVTGDRAAFEPGDLLVIDTKAHGRFQKASTPYSSLISGVYATKPGVTGRRQPRSKPSNEEVPMAMVGIVPTKVSTENGPIHDGDLLVSSSTPGYAMKGTDRARMMGAVIGKALAPLEAGSGVIEVLISMQ